MAMVSAGHQGMRYAYVTQATTMPTQGLMVADLADLTIRHGKALTTTASQSDHTWSTRRMLCRRLENRPAQVPTLTGALLAHLLSSSGRKCCLTSSSTSSRSRLSR